jgi:hypothetical protein
LPWLIARVFIGRQAAVRVQLGGERGSNAWPHIWIIAAIALQEHLGSAPRQSADFISRVNSEDIMMVESVQRGRHSPAFVGGQIRGSARGNVAAVSKNIGRENLG